MDVNFPYSGLLSIPSESRKGKGINRYIAFADVFVFSNDEITDIDNRIILILNEDDIDDSFIGKLGRLKIVQVEKTYYVAYLESIVGE